MKYLLEKRKEQVYTKDGGLFRIKCDSKSVAGSVSQRACVFCGSRVVLYPITDALHLIHGPIGCASYTWDIRGSMSSGSQLNRMSFCTDLNEDDVIFGAEKKLYHALSELIDTHQPKAAFIYATCIIGLIGDDLEAICRRVEKEKGIQVIPVEAPGFAGIKKDGYRVACEAIFKLVGKGKQPATMEKSINIIGDFNLAGELWLLKEYYEKMGITIVATMTGDGRVDEIRQAHRAALNVIQCSGSMMHLARMLKTEYNTPFIRVSYFGIEDMSDALYEAAKFFKDEAMMEKAQQLVQQELGQLLPALSFYKEKLAGKKAAIYVGGAFKAISLIKALRLIGIDTVIAGSQTGNPEDYELMHRLCKPGTIIVDDTNPNELSGFIKEKGADILIGGVKERPIAYKMGLGFCDHNHERKEALAGYVGMLNFAKEVYGTIYSPVWQFVKSNS